MAYIYFNALLRHAVHVVVQRVLKPQEANVFTIAYLHIQNFCDLK